jgi:bacteriocin-like protein
MSNETGNATTPLVSAIMHELTEEKLAEVSGGGSSSDVEGLLQLVLSQGFSIEAAITRDNLNDMNHANSEKSQLRQLQTKSK